MTKINFRVQTEGGFLVLAAMMLLLLPLRWVLAAALAMGVHELFHAFAIRLLGGRVYGLRLGIGGAKMDAAPMPPDRELFAALAGPIGSALLVLTAKYTPRLAVCALVHCVVNLIPLFPLDGGRIARDLCYLLRPPERAERTFRIFQRVLTAVLTLVCVVLCARHGVALAAALFVFLLRQRKMRTV